jgi:hypothetical protein
MSTVAEAVYRGTDGSVHYMSSTPAGSQLIITDPVLGVRRIGLNGPYRLVHRCDTGSVQYESISTQGAHRSLLARGSSPISAS